MNYPNIRLRKLQGQLERPWMLRVQLAPSERYETLLYSTAQEAHTEAEKLAASMLARGYEAVTLYDHRNGGAPHVYRRDPVKK